MLDTIAVGTDGSETAKVALEFAMDLAGRCEARLVIISAFRPIDEISLKHEKAQVPADMQWSVNPTEEVDEILASAARRAQGHGLEVVTVASDKGDPADVLCRMAEEQEADLLVIGNKGIQRRVLGSVPRTVSQNAHCSVVIVKTT